MTRQGLEDQSPQPQHPHARRRRAQGAMAVVALLVAVLAVAFFRIQVLASSTYKLRAESNRLRPIDIVAPRGTIYDRYGKVIADNVPAYGVSILPAPTDSIRATLFKLQRYLGLSEEALASLDEKLVGVHTRPFLVESDAPFEAVSAIEERRSEFPNVLIETRPKRRYTSGPVVAHIMGQMGEINAVELASADFPADRYEQRMFIGKTGIERRYETELQGVRGIRYLEVDAGDRVVGDFQGRVAQASQPGEDLVLNIDLALQEWIHEIFPKDKSGAVVALDPEDGGVLALYSYPTFDPNAFVGGIGVEEWERLEADTLDPIFNRTVQGKFPPASTFKPVVAVIALDLGIVDPEAYMEEPCTGSYQYGRSWGCWKEDGHGALDMFGAIRDSCNVYFYQLGLGIGLDRLLERGLHLGLDRRCGIDLPEETGGVFPEDRDYWERRFGARARESEVLSLAIGQGPNSQTPLKVAQLYLALARDGSAPAPSLAKNRPDSVEGWDLDLRPEHLAMVREGLRQVTAPGGTAALSALEAWDLLGKTGTGETVFSQLGEREDDAWFAGFAGPRGGDPEIVIVVMVERGEGGSSMAAPIAAKAADFYLRQKHGLPFDTIQTLLEHIEAGLPFEEAGIAR